MIVYLCKGRLANIFWCDHFVTGSRVLLEPHLMNAFNTFLQKPITEVVDSVVARNVRAPAATKVPAAAIKKVNDKHRPEDVIVISSEETEKSKPVSRVPRKEVKTLTSILTARSKVIREFRFWFMYNLFYPFDCLFTDVVCNTRPLVVSLRIHWWKLMLLMLIMSWQ